MKQINDVLSRTLIPLSATSIQIGMMCAAPFMRLSPKTNNNNQQLGKRYQYYRARITHRVDNVTVERFFC